MDNNHSDNGGQHVSQVPGPSYMGAVPPASVPKPPLEHEKRDSIFVLLSLIVAFTFCQCILFGGLGLGVPVTVVVFYAVVCLYLRRRHRLLTKKNIITFIPVLLITLCFFLFDNEALTLLNVPVLWGFAALNLLSVSGLDVRPLFRLRTIVDLFLVTFEMPFMHLGASVKVLGANRKDAGKGSKALRILLALLIISPLAMIVLALLGSSDENFGWVLKNILSYINSTVWQYVLKTIIAVIITFPLFSLFYTLRYAVKTDSEVFDTYKYNTKRLDGYIVTVALSVFSAIYIVYMVMQTGYFFSAFSNVLPAGFTPANYARRGFFELVAVAAINFCIIAAAVLFTRERNGKMPKSSRFSILLLSVLTMLIIVTAASKMLMYIGTHGLTPLRVFTTWFMLVLFLINLYIIFKIISPGFRFACAAAITVCALYIGLNYADTDRIIACWNISRYNCGVSALLDVNMLSTLSNSAVAPLSSLADDPIYGSDVKEILSDRSKSLQIRQWQAFTVSGFTAAQAIKGTGIGLSSR